MKSNGQNCLILLVMSLFSILFGCKEKKTPEVKYQASPRFPLTDDVGARFTTVDLDGFSIWAFYIAGDRRSIFVLGKRDTDFPDEMAEDDEPQPRQFDQVDCRLFCLDTSGKVSYSKDFLKTDWMNCGSFGILDDAFAARVGDFFLILDPKTLDVLEKIPVHDPTYISWKEPDMTFDEKRDDYQAKFEKLYDNPNAKYLDWTPEPEFLVFVQGPKGKRSAWLPESYDDSLLNDLKQRFEPIMVPRNPTVVLANSTTNLSITDGNANIKEMEVHSAGRQLDYPNYKNRSVLEYELELNGKKYHFSTSDKDRHNLQLQFSDNLYLTTTDGKVWVIYEGGLYYLDTN